MKANPWQIFTLFTIIFRNPAIANYEVQLSTKTRSTDSLPLASPEEKSTIRQSEPIPETSTPTIKINETEDMQAREDQIAKVALMTHFKYQEFKLPSNYIRIQTPYFAFGSRFIQRDYVKAYIQTPDFDFNAFVKRWVQAVYITLRIIAVNDLDEINEEITIMADLIVEWMDVAIPEDLETKLSMNESMVKIVTEIVQESYETFVTTLDPTLLTQIWKPDIIIENVVKVTHPKLMSQPITMRLNTITGNITYISRSLIQMQCNMDFHYFPADTQSCDIVIRSNSYSKEELRLLWATPFGVYLETCEGSNFDFQITALREYEKDERYSGISKTRSFSTLQLTILARRKLSYHMVQTFIPSVFFIVITWLCFLIPSNMIEARIGVTMTTLLTLTAMFASVRESTPSVSYVRAIDIWMLSCIVFVFLTLLEFTLLLWLRKRRGIAEEEGNETDDLEKACVTLRTKEGKEELHLLHVQNNTQAPSRRKTESNASETIEKYAFPIFSFIFVLFTGCYWSWLLIGSEYFIWDVDHSINNC